MDAKEKLDYWVDKAEYDLVTAEALFGSGRWLYVVFMCQQAIEKLVKGLYIIFTNEDPPRIHDITKVLQIYAGKLPNAVSKDQYDLFDRLLSFYLEGRYPEYLSKASDQVSNTDARELLDQTKEAYAWLMEQLRLSQM